MKAKGATERRVDGEGEAGFLKIFLKIYCENLTLTSMQEADLEIFKEFANRVHLQFPESKVWLFGSRARGDHYPDSDFDILVVIKDLSKANKRIISDLAWEVGFERNLLLAPIVYNFERFSYPAIQKSLFISNVMREGILA